MSTKRQTGELTPSNQTVGIEITERDTRFLEFCRRIGWGSLMVQIKDGQPNVSRILTREYRHDQEMSESVELVVSEAAGVSWRNF